MGSQPLLALRMRLTVVLVLTTLGFLAEANPRPKPDPLTVKAHVAVNVKPGEADAQESAASGAREGWPWSKGCWKKCGQKPGPCKACKGAKSHCCKKGVKGNGCNGKQGSKKGKCVKPDPDVSEETDYTDTDSQELDPGFHTIPGCLKAKSSCDPRGKPTCCGTCVVDAREGKKGFVCDARTETEIMRVSKDTMRGEGCGVMKMITCGVSLTTKLLACVGGDIPSCVQQIIAGGIGDCKDCICALVEKVLGEKLGPPLC